MVHNDVLFRPFLISRGYLIDESDRYNMINSANGSNRTNTVGIESNEDN